MLILDLFQPELKSTCTIPSRGVSATHPEGKAALVGAKASFRHEAQAVVTLINPKLQDNTSC